MPRIFASIDIGSNAVRLLFSNVYASENRMVSEKATLVRIPVRLGLDVFQSGEISEHRINLLTRTLQAFKLLIDVYNPVAYQVCATAAMREATNQQEVINKIKECSGLTVQVITGQEEAKLLSSCNNLNLEQESPWQLYCDVGGGSTEVTLFHNDHIVASESFQLGTIRILTNTLGKSDWNILKEWVKRKIPTNERVYCNGSGGNINKLVKLFGNTANSSISRKALKHAHNELYNLSVEKRLKKYGMREDRADVIVPAAEIFLRLMKWGGIDKIVAPRFGLADGMAIAQYEEYAIKHDLPLPAKENRSIHIT